MVVRFRPGKLGEKPDFLTRRVDYYPTGEYRDYTLTNPQNLRPVFSQEELASSLRATRLQEVSRDADSLSDIHILILDAAALFEDIKSSLQVGPTAKRELDRLLKGLPSTRFSLSPSGPLLLDARVYVPDHRPDQGSLRTRVLQSKHDHLTAGHFGFNKTLALLRRDYARPNMRTDCKRFVAQCVLCARNKSNRHRPYGLLQPLPIPERLWHSISMYFIEQLPSSNGFTSILVVIDRLSKESVFIPTTDNATAIDVADAFVKHVFSKHGIPLHISSDRGSEFTSHFFRSLGSLLRMRLHFTSGHHPSANGQVERINTTLEQFLRIYCNYQQDNWSKLLPLAGFAYNNAPHASTGVSPFFATKGYDPLMAVYPDAEITDLRAHHFAINFDEIHRFLRERMKDAMTQSANDTSAVLGRQPRLLTYRPYSYQPHRPEAGQKEDRPLFHHFPTVPYVLHPLTSFYH
jgi:transposase InsO family protein